MEVDITVIGLGIAGASVLDGLCKNGKENGITCCGIDQSTIAGQTTGMSAATYSCVSDNPPPASVEPNEYLAAGSLRIFRDLQVEEFDIELKQVGAIEVALTDEVESYLKQKYAMLVKQNLHGNVKLLTNGEEIRKSEPTLRKNAMKCAIEYEFGGYVNPVLLTNALIERAKRNGGVVRENVNVVSITQSPSAQLLEENFSFFERFSPCKYAYEIVATDKDAFGKLVIKTNQIIIATGVCTDDALSKWFGIKSNLIQPTKAQAVLIPNRSLRKVVYCSEVYARNLKITHESETAPRLAHHVYGRNMGDCMFFGYDRVKQNDLGDYAESNKRLVENVSYLHSFLDFDLKSVLSGSWVCLMPVSSSNRPIYGRLSQMEGIYLATGLGANGIERGPCLGHLLAEEILSREEGRKEIREKYIADYRIIM